MQIQTLARRIRYMLMISYIRHIFPTLIAIFLFLNTFFIIYATYEKFSSLKLPQIVVDLIQAVPQSANSFKIANARKTIGGKIHQTTDKSAALKGFETQV